MDLDKKILERIEKENIRIKPRWFFVAKDLLLDVVFFALIVAGAISFGLILDAVNFDRAEIIISGLPLFWISAFSIIILGAYKISEKIDWFRRMKVSTVVLALLVINFAFGYVVFASGEASKLEQKLEEVKAYQAIFPMAELRGERGQDASMKISDGTDRDKEDDGDTGGENNDAKGGEAHADKGDARKGAQESNAVPVKNKAEQGDGKENGQSLPVKRVMTVTKDADEDGEVKEKADEDSPEEISSQVSDDNTDADAEDAADIESQDDPAD